MVACGQLQKPIVSRETSGSVVALVGEAGGLHVVAGSVCEAPGPGEKRQALCFLQHDLQLLKVLQPSHILVLDRKGKNEI